METIKGLIKYCITNPQVVVLWALGVVTGWLLIVEVLMKLAQFTKSETDDRIIGKVHSVLISIRDFLLRRKK